MTGLLTRLAHPGGRGWWPRARSRRGEAAAVRLRAAHLTFDDSVLALRKAALDHVDCQDHASTALRANLDWLSGRLRNPLGGGTPRGAHGTSAAVRP